MATAEKIGSRCAQGIATKLVKKWLLVLVERPEGWEPQSWDDIPIGAEYLGIEAKGLTFSRARDYAFGFNGCSLLQGGSVWLILRRDYGRTVGSTRKTSRLKLISV